MHNENAEISELLYGDCEHTPLQFSSPEDFYNELQFSDMYCPELGYYVFSYNDRGAVCHYDIDLEEAAELSKMSRKYNDYWAAYLGPGGHIWDAEGDTETPPNPGCSNKDFCEAYYNHKWYTV